MTGNVAEIRGFIIENFLFDADTSDLKNDESFLDLGIIDSTGVLELVGWLEEVYGIEVGDDELVPENLDSVDNISKFIDRKVQKEKNGRGVYDRFSP